MNSIEKEVKFIIECHEKCGDDKDFLQRLKELFLTGDISKPAYEIAKLMYPDIEKPKKKAPEKTESDPCSCSRGSSGVRLSC